MLKKVIEISGVSLLKVKTHKFNPQGLSIVAFLNDSYMSVHSWPEIGYAAVDIYTSTPCVYPECVISVIKDYLGPQRVQVLDFHRGNGA
jgi:S-adenosylmethionine decarboxylase